MDVYLARQPIYDRELNVVAYELLYRAGEEKNRAGPLNDPDGASTRVLVNAFSEIGLDKITGGLPALINVTEKFLVSGALPASLKGKLIPELLENITITNQLIDSLKKMVDSGYQFALDDFQYQETWRPLMDLSSIVKIDVMTLGKSGTMRQVHEIRRSNQCKAKLLAEKVETHQEFEFYKALGFDYFQGYFLARPNIVKDKGIPASKMVILSLVGVINDPKSDVEDVERVVSQDARLSFKLLKIVNSAAFALRREVRTIAEAVNIIGFNELRIWANMLSLSSIDNKPNNLLLTGMVRAKMCQLLAKKFNYPDANIYFTTGLISLLDALLDLPIEAVLEQMPIARDIKDAILFRTGILGKLLDAVIAYEEGRWEDTNIPPISTTDIFSVYIEALEWAQVSSHSMFNKSA